MSWVSSILRGADKIISKITPWNDDHGIGKILTGIGTSYIPGLSIGGGLSKIGLGVGGVSLPNFTIGGGKSQIGLDTLLQGYGAYQSNKKLSDAMNAYRAQLSGVPTYEMTPQERSAYLDAANMDINQVMDRRLGGTAANLSGRGLLNTGRTLGVLSNQRDRMLTQARQGMYNTQWDRGMALRNQSLNASPFMLNQLQDQAKTSSQGFADSIAAILQGMAYDKPTSSPMPNTMLPERLLPLQNTGQGVPLSGPTNTYRPSLFGGETAKPSGMFIIDPLKF